MNGISLQDSLSDVGRALFREFRLKVSDIKFEPLKNDAYVARWLKARNWDVEKAEIMFRNHTKWREETNIDSILTWFTPPEVINLYFPGGMCGQDKFGRPAYICPAGTADVFGLMKSASRSQLLNSRYHLMETVLQNIFPAHNARLSPEKHVDQLVIIFDLQHMNRRQLWRPWLSFVQELTSIFDVNYPELMAVCFVLNAPSFFSLVFSLLKPLLSKETQDKIHILGSNYHDDLLKLFDPEHLPAHYGGMMTDPDGDPKCPSRICWGGTVPASYYISRPSDVTTATDEDAPIDESYVLVAVGRGSKESLCIGELKATDILSWEFFTETNDIAFSLWVDPITNSSPLGSKKSNGLDGWLKNGVLNKLNSQKSFESSNPVANSKPTISPSVSFSIGSTLSGLGGNSAGKFWKQVTQSTRVDCDLVPEVGQKKVEIEGTYYLCFDNTYSWTRSKRVWCRVEIQSSDGNTIVTKEPTDDCQTCTVETAIETEPTAELQTEEQYETELQNNISTVLNEVNKSTHRIILGSNLDTDLVALTMILLRNLPLIKRRHRTKSSSMK